MKLYTAGYQGKTARDFFETLRENGIERLIDIRIYPDGVREGYARRRDLGYLLGGLLGCEYDYCSILAPTPEMLKSYHQNPDWPKYVAEYAQLMEDRNIPAALDAALFTRQKCCLLCFEASPVQCHRRLAAERIAGAWKNVEIVHL